MQGDAECTHMRTTIASSKLEDFPEGITKDCEAIALAQAQGLHYPDLVSGV